MKYSYWQFGGRHYNELNQVRRSKAVMSFFHDRGWIKVLGATIIFFALFIGLGLYQLEDISSAKEKEDLYRELKMFANVLDMVKRNYVEEVSAQKLIYGAIDGMLHSLDPHSSFLKPDEYKELQIETKGSFSGIGIEITIKDGVLTVVSPIEGTPAYRAGLKANDKIIKINGKSTKNITLMQAVKKLRGKKGTKVTISIYREGWHKLKDITIVRDVIPIKSVRFHTIEKDYGYVRIRNFQKKTSGELKEALSKLEKENKGLKGLILDLRSNPGGLLDQAVKVSDEFLDEGLIVYTKGRIKGQEMKFKAHPDHGAHPYPIVVLVNQGSASASEIVAGALQDHKRAIIIGEATFGKGSVQTVIPLEDGAALRLTTALYYTPSGRSIQAKGIVPDIEVPFIPPEENKKKKDSKNHFLKEKDLKGHLPNFSELDEKKEKKSDEESEEQLEDNATDEEKDGKKPEFTMDNQMEEALRILKAWNIFAQTKKGACSRTDH